MHLRMCMSCGHIGCCDSSPNRHATAHFQAEQHPIIQSYEPGEDWWWCYVDEVAFTVEDGPSFAHAAPGGGIEAHRAARSAGH